MLAIATARRGLRGSELGNGAFENMSFPRGYTDPKSLVRLTEDEAKQGALRVSGEIFGGVGPRMTGPPDVYQTDHRAGNARISGRIAGAGAGS